MTPFENTPENAFRIEALKQVNRFISALEEVLAGGYPRVERDGWSEKLTQARAVVAGTLKPEQATALLPECQIMKRDIQAVAQKVIAKGEQFAALSSAVAGFRQLAEAGIAAAQSPDEIEPLLMAGLQQKVALMLAQLVGAEQAQTLLAQVEQRLNQPE